MVVFPGDAGVEVVEVVELVGAETVLDEEVFEGVELVVGADHDLVVAREEGEVVGELDDVGVEGVEGRERLGAGLPIVEVAVDVFDLDPGERLAETDCGGRGWSGRSRAAR